MKTAVLKHLFSVLALASVASFASQARATVSDDLSSLGSNAESVKRANRLESRSRIAIVQNRTVDRHWRLELGANYGAVAGGDSYVNTQNASINADLHISPKFSLGVHYAKAFNQLTPEGKNQFDRAQAMKNAGQLNYNYAAIDYPESSILGIVNWYMMYGKINFFDMSVIQFDIYSLVGGGQVQLASGSAPTYTAGGGIGFWISQHVTSRLEVRYQGYTDHVYTGDRNLNLIVANLGIGVLL